MSNNQDGFYCVCGDWVGEPTNGENLCPMCYEYMEDGELEVDEDEEDVI